jgi:hypothetical protein
MHNRTLALRICRGTVAFVWLYHGLFPKLLGPDATELAMDMAMGVGPEAARTIAYTAGGVEILIGLSVLLFWRQRWPLWLTLVLMPGLLGFVALVMPGLLTAAFNPVTVNACVMALAWLSLWLQGDAGNG